MTNKTITLACPFCGSKELKQVTDDGIHFTQCESCEATGPTGFKRGDDDAVDWNTRAALADPVPPAGGDKLARLNQALDGGYDRKKFEKVRDEICGSAAKPALYLDAKGFEIVTRCLTVSACIDVRAHHAGELFDHYRPYGLVPVYSEETITRLQAEVERLTAQKADAVAVVDETDDGLFIEIIYGDDGSSLRRGDKLYTAPSDRGYVSRLAYDALQAELTKAQELIADMVKQRVEAGTDYTADVGRGKAYLSNQSAPADKGQGEPVARVRHSPVRKRLSVELLRSNMKDGDLLYAEQPAPVAVLPEKYDDVLLPFLSLMRAELHANARKGDRPGWLQMDRKTAVLEVFYHMGKLHMAVHRNDKACIKEYAADVANMCMMLTDVCGCLNSEPKP